MAIKVNPKSLKLYLWNDGPYIYFYDGNCGGINYKNLQYLNSKAKNYKIVKVLQIEWSEQLIFDYLTPKDAINTIYVYFQGEIKFKLNSPSFDEIDFVFLKCLEFHNNKIEKQVKNVGKRLEKWCRERNIMKNSNNNSKILEYLSPNLKYRRKYILKKKIEIKPDEKIPPEINPLPFQNENIRTKSPILYESRQNNKSPNTETLKHSPYSSKIKKVPDSVKIKNPANFLHIKHDHDYIELKNYPITLETMSDSKYTKLGQIPFITETKSIKNLTKISNLKMNNKYISKEYNKNPMKMKKVSDLIETKWFYDVKIENLPVDFLEE